MATKRIDVPKDDEQSCKKAKADDENVEAGGKESENILSGFHISNVLSDSAREKIIFVHGQVYFWTVKCI